MNNTQRGFIKLPRGLIESRSARNPLQLALFVRILLQANREAKEWNGITVQRGQLATSLRSLSDNSGLTVSQVRTALQSFARDGLAHHLTHGLAHAKKAGVAHGAAHGDTIVTICNFDSYEGKKIDLAHGAAHGETSTDAHGAAHAIAHTKEYIKKYYINNPDFVPIVEEWMAYKKERGQEYKGQKGLTQFCSRLLDLSAGDAATARRLVGNAMAANWATVYEERPQTGTQAPRKSACRTRTQRTLSIDEGDLYETTF